jgi:hypothetical protein
MKKYYQKPEQHIIVLQHRTMLMSVSNPVGSVDSGDADIHYSGGSNQAARVKSNTVDWDEWE